MKSCTFVNPLQGIQAAAAADSKFDSEVLFAQGAQIDTPDTSGIAAAVEAASKADVAIVVTGLITCQEKGAQCQEAEARDRSTPVDASGHDNSSSTTDIGRDYGIGLPGQQLALIKALAEKTRTKIVLVVMSGSGVAVPWAAASPRVSSIIQLFYPGVLGGEALADVLFGKAAPGGKLNVMIATGEEQLPVDYLSQSMKIAPGRTHAYFTGVYLFCRTIILLLRACLPALCCSANKCPCLRHRQAAVLLWLWAWLLELELCQPSTLALEPLLRLERRARAAHRHGKPTSLGPWC